jgi:3-hydroxyisobutyrate dehydrogenase-like beta-hydroxyacid dehydrogenase
MTTIGFVGLGAMGGRIAGRLLAAGHHVYGTNRTPARAAALREAGLDWRDTPREVAEQANVIFTMVADDAALEAVTSGPDGLLAALGPGQVYVDMSTVSPRASRELARRVRALGADMLDAPVSGSVPAATDGTLAIMAGGSERAFHQVEPLLHELGRSVTYVGGSGQGLVLKLAINTSLAAQTLAFAEGLLLAERAGVDPKLALEVMTGSAIGSPALRARGPLMLDLPEEAWFDVSLMHKDIGLALDAAGAAGVPLPSGELADAMLARATELGYGHRDLAALFEVLAQLNGPLNGANDEGDRASSSGPAHERPSDH